MELARPSGATVVLQCATAEHFPHPHFYEGFYIKMFCFVCYAFKALTVIISLILFYVQKYSSNKQMQISLYLL